MGLDFVPTGVPCSQAGSIIAGRVVNAIGALSATVLSAGLYWLSNVGANVTVQVMDETGTWNNITAAAVGGLIMSDGTNVRLSNAAGVSQNATTQKIG